jgi:hypothetical protein
VRRLVGPAVVSVECSSSYDETGRMVTFPGTHHVDALVAYVRAHPTDTVEVSIGTEFLGRDATRYATEAITACGVNAPCVRPHAHREPVHRIPDRARLTEVFERLAELKTRLTSLTVTAWLEGWQLDAIVGLLPSTLDGLRMRFCGMLGAELVDALSELAQLRYLDLGLNHLNFAAIAPPLAAMRELRELDLTWTVVDPTLLRTVLTTTRQLEKLVLHDCLRTGLPAELATELFAMPRLTLLRVSRCGLAFRHGNSAARTPLETVCAAASDSSPMEELDLSENDLFHTLDYRNLHALFTRLPRLAALHMQHDLHFDEDMLVSALDGLPDTNRRELHLSYDPKSRLDGYVHAAGAVDLVWHTPEEHSWWQRAHTRRPWLV